MTDKPASTPVAADPLVTQYVEKALDEVRSLLPAEDLEVYRAYMYVFYETNPVAVKLLNEIRDAQREVSTVGKSAEVARRDDATLAAAVNRRRARGAGK